MAAINQNLGGKKSSKRLPTYIDMTPMVDQILTSNILKF